MKKLTASLIHSSSITYENRPFFTRRIGVTKDLDGNTIQNKIRAGVRLSGKLTKRLRIGLLNMQTAKDEENLISSNNNTVLSFQQNVFSKSNFKFSFVLIFFNF